MVVGEADATERDELKRRLADGHGAHELVAGATRGASEVLAATEEYLTHGVPNDDVSTELFQPDKLHPNAMGHRRWATCLEDELSRWGVQ